MLIDPVADPGETADATLLYIAWGPSRIVGQAVVSAMTFIRAVSTSPRRWRIAVYTDQPERFEAYGIPCVRVPLTVLDEDPASTYGFRRKLLAIKHAASRFDGHLVFIDADTCVYADPEPFIAALDRGTCLMHTREYQLDDSTRPGLRAAIARPGARTRHLRTAAESSHVDVWNSGVVAVARTHKSLIADALAVCDELYARSGSRISEQVAFSIVMGQDASIEPADGFVAHFWWCAEQYTYYADRFLSTHRGRDLEQLVDQLVDLQLPIGAVWRTPLRLRPRIAARAARRHVRGLDRRIRSGRSPTRVREPQDDVPLSAHAQIIGARLPTLAR